MIGWRGCSRYISPVYRPAFLAELEAIQQVRTDKGLKNAMVMLPFVRNTWELEEIAEMMRAEGLRRSRDFQLYLMAEVPSTVLLAREFSKHCDGFSIGSNDLTQLVLGADRDSEILGRMGYFDERDPAVLRAVEMLIEGAHASGRTVGICGQGPSVYPEFAEFLVRKGIDSISLNADTVVGTIRSIAALEQRMKLDGLRARRRLIDRYRGGDLGGRHRGGVGGRGAGTSTHGIGEFGPRTGFPRARTRGARAVGPLDGPARACRAARPPGGTHGAARDERAHWRLPGPGRTGRSRLREDPRHAHWSTGSPRRCRFHPAQRRAG